MIVTSVSTCGLQRQSNKGKLSSNEVVKSPRLHIEHMNSHDKTICTNADFPGGNINTSSRSPSEVRKLSTCCRRSSFEITVSGEPIEQNRPLLVLLLLDDDGVVDAMIDDNLNNKK